MKPACLFVLSMLILVPVAGLAYQDSATPPTSPATPPASASPANRNAADRLPGFSPQAIRKVRVDLYFQAAREPLAKLAPQVYALASNSERCRLSSGAQACDLPGEPLKGSDLRQILKYYVKGPVEAALDQQQLDIHKSDWTWQPYVNRRNR
ncbi:MAG: hypothetical protein ACRD3T_19060 [Terriglobia bacterium]